VDAPAGDITLLLHEWKAGDACALERLMPLAYPELRQIAAAYMRRERNQLTLQATALVNELYLRLLNQRRVDLKDREHFYALAAKMMRMILVDHARSNLTLKRGSDFVHVPLSEDLPWVNLNNGDIIELNVALDELDATDPRKARLVELRYFLGCTAEEAGEALKISKTTVDRDLKLVKSWLYRRLCPAGIQPETVAG
jgi:RNA polymerase sigma factor (TIGR02999 family)